MVQQQRSGLAKHTLCWGSGGPISTPGGWPSNLATDGTRLCKSPGTKKTTSTAVIHASSSSDTDNSGSYSLPWSNCSIGPIDEWHPNTRAVGYSLMWPWRAQVRSYKWHVLNSLININCRASRRRDSENDDIREPPILNPKGRPRERRITGATEGRPQGGGARAQPKAVQTRKCGLCGKTGHTRRSCPTLKNL
jgi:hypothetical protein